MSAKQGVGTFSPFPAHLESNVRVDIRGQSDTDPSLHFHRPMFLAWRHVRRLSSNYANPHKQASPLKHQTLLCSPCKHLVNKHPKRPPVHRSAVPFALVERNRTRVRASRLGNQNSEIGRRQQHDFYFLKRPRLLRRLCRSETESFAILSSQHSR